MACFDEFITMNTSRIIAPLAIGIGLLAASAAHASDVAIPDRARLQAMSQEEFAVYREQIQSRIEGLGAAEQRLMQETSVNGRSQMDNRNAGGGYGKGYGSRNGQGSGQGGGRGGGRHR